MSEQTRNTPNNDALAVTETAVGAIHTALVNLRLASVRLNELTDDELKAIESKISLHDDELGCLWKLYAVHRRNRFREATPDNPLEFLGKMLGGVGEFPFPPPPQKGDDKFPDQLGED